MAKVAIVGAGFVGLAAAFKLAKAGDEVFVFEKNSYPGGLAAGFKESSWDWYLDHHYHHIFASDKEIKQFAKDLGLESSLFFKRPKTSIYYQQKTFQLDSPTSLLTAPVFGWLTKFRVGLTLAFLKLLPESLGLRLEKWTAKEFLIKTMGTEAWQILWQPLFEDKFAEKAASVNAAWFWARIKARTPSLGYFKGGFGQFSWQVVNNLKKLGVKFYFDTSIKSINQVNQHWQVISANSKSHSLIEFDKVLVTLPADQVSQLVKTKKTKKSLPWKKSLDYLSAVTLIIEADKPFFQDKTYWLNVNDLSFPFLAVVEQTHFINKKHYGGKHIIYVGKYLHKNHPFYKLDAQALFHHYQKSLEVLSPHFSQSVKRVWRFQAPFAQPVVAPNHSRLVPKIKTPLQGFYWASMQHIYPWDRGTNFAVKLGFEVAEVIKHE